jgi:hypothetical protein
MGDAADGGVRGVIDPLRRVLSGLAEASRERASERRARVAARQGSATRFPRSGLLAALEARAAVRAGVRLDDFLRRQLAQYATRLPIPLEDLPVTVEVTGGEAVVRARGHGPAAPSGDAGGEPPLGGELATAEATLASLDARAARARERVEACERELADAIAAGRVISRAAVDATLEQLGRPPVPPPWPAHAARAFVAVLAAAEAWRFAGPALAASGLEASPELTLRTAPVPAAFALAFAAGAAAAAFVLAGAALTRAAAALAAGGDAARRAVALSGTAALLVPAIAAAAAAPERWAQLALLGVIPFAGAALWRAADTLDVRRAAASAEALAWDRARAVEAMERARREEVILRAAADLDGILAERERAAAALRSLRRSALAGQRRGALAARSEASRLDRLSEGLACALELDRYLYLRLSAGGSVTKLERPARRPEPPVTAGLGVAS